ncbi:hypothetical protein FB480_103424 [Agrobacterium vitis]|nr:hypothetical protein FB480_103424 [Agrobacterium vitis]
MAEQSTVDAKSHNEAYPTNPENLTPFRLHFSDGSTADVSAGNPAEARKRGSREGLAISKVKMIKGGA